MAPRRRPHGALLLAVALLACTPPRGSRAEPPPAGRPGSARAELRVLPWSGFKAALSFTFDDALPSQIVHSGALRATGARVTYYLTTAGHRLPGFDAAWRRALGAGDELGNHTVNHCTFDGSCPAGRPALASMSAEIDACSAYITGPLGAAAVFTMAYPFGDRRYAPLARERFFLARGTSPGMIGANDATDPFNLPCIAAQGGEDATELNGAIDRAGRDGKWLVLVFHALLPGEDAYAGVAIGEVTGSIRHAQSRRDVWIDTVANVGAYWRGQIAFTNAELHQDGQRRVWRWRLPPHFPSGKALRVVAARGTLTQASRALRSHPAGYYEVALDARELTWSP